MQRSCARRRRSCLHSSIRWARSSRTTETSMNRQRLFLLAIAAVLAAAAQAASTDIPANVAAAAKAHINAGTLAAPIRFLASDELEGRGPATRGDALARRYLATELESLGYLPGFADKSWVQPVNVVGTKAQLPKTWSFKGKGGDVDLKWSDDYIAGSGVQTETAGFDKA